MDTFSWAALRLVPAKESTCDTLVEIDRSTTCNAQGELKKYALLNFSHDEIYRLSRKRWNVSCEMFLCGVEVS